MLNFYANCRGSTDCNLFDAHLGRNNIARFAHKKDNRKGQVESVRSYCHVFCDARIVEVIYVSHVQGHSRLQLFVEVRLITDPCFLFMWVSATLKYAFSVKVQQDELLPPGLCVPSLMAVCVTTLL